MSEAPGARRPLEPPSRFRRPSALGFALIIGVVAFFIASLDGAEVSLVELVQGLPNMGRMLGEMIPPSTERLLQVGTAVLETFQMALVGTVFGVVLSLPLAWFAARGLTPHPTLYFGARGLIALFRTVPDLIWALFFVVAVGLGPFAGTLALAVDTMGFCGRFFAEAMEEQDKGPQEALRAIGAPRSGILIGAVLPGALPSFIGTSLFSLEKATRSSVVLGLVGAGGIGIELKVAMDMFEYAEAATIILFVFVLVLLVERASAYLRARVIG